MRRFACGQAGRAVLGACLFLALACRRGLPVPMGADPEPGEARRWAKPLLAGFILKLGSDATFDWAQTVAFQPILSVAATADGGVLAGGGKGGAYVTRLCIDGTGVWTFRSGGSSTTAQAVAARGASFAVAGLTSGSSDFDPGSS